MKYLNRSKKVLIEGNAEWENMQVAQDPEVARSLDQIARGDWKKTMRAGLTEEQQVRFREPKISKPSKASALSTLSC